MNQFYHASGKLAYHPGLIFAEGFVTILKMLILFDRSFVRKPDIVHDESMPKEKAEIMLSVAGRLGFGTMHENNGDGTMAIAVFTGTPENSNKFWGMVEKDLDEGGNGAERSRG